MYHKSGCDSAVHSTMDGYRVYVERYVTIA